MSENQPGKKQSTRVSDALFEIDNMSCDLRLWILMTVMSGMFTLVSAYVSSYLFNIYKLIVPSLVLSIWWHIILRIIHKSVRETNIVMKPKKYQIEKSH